MNRVAVVMNRLFVDSRWLLQVSSSSFDTSGG
jgi:hypothetical protein